MKISKTISFDLYLINEYEKRETNLNELINKLLAEHLAILEVKQELLTNQKQ